MITQEAVQELAERFARPVEIGGRVYLPEEWKEHDPNAPPSPTALQVGTLSGLASFVKENIDGLDPAKLLLHVVNPTSVYLRGKLDGEEKQYRRPIYVEARADLPSFAFGQFQEIENFLIALHIAFEPSPGREALVAFLGSINESEIRTSDDDGFSQIVATRQGITAKAEKVPNPVRLVRYRTFVEIDQPEGAFLVRLQKGHDKPKVALFEADGGAWRPEAAARVAAWLSDNIPNVQVVA